MNTLAEFDVADQAVIALNEYFGDANWTVESLTDDDNSGRSGWLRSGDLRLPFSSQPNLSGKRLINVAKQSALPSETVFVVPFVNPELRARCLEEGINYLDSAGNCRIVHGSTRWVIDSQSAQPQRPLTSGRGFKYNGLKFIYACYEEPELLSASYRQMAEKMELSLGTISGIIEDLRKDDFLVTQPDGSHAFNHGRELFQRWAYAYLDEVRPVLFRQQLRAMKEDYLERIDAMSPEGGVLLGGERAAMARSGSLRSPNFSLHSNERLGELVKKYHLTPFNRKPQGATVIDLYSVFYASPRQYADQQRMPAPIVGDLIILAELLTTHESRQLEAADELLVHEIQDRFTKFGLQW
ncbi:type IV toxin-antitoxin system AbiEi family antitoxin [Neolewinella lacunae]|uniref:Uncharacterized protein n=1 Tax=Neolewinella lacunae TaxID=1517758 RepID=A0A923T885_9BACT|nr:type IV toxin-antitoxin system AbiEi family antitoxin [Neolewinella lacunae]MBC6994316.1 hypothetical protein [Neolewinella lacunae]MDN3634925.1 type IV toxin-antitoxin system AbiEi family antitoxin [Neolewinella lacunae]